MLSRLFQHSAKQNVPLCFFKQTSLNTFSTSAALRRVVLVDGVRLPFAKSMTIYNDLLSYDLSREAIKGLLVKTGISPDAIDYVIMGTVIQEVRTSNIAREAALGAGLPKSCPAHTVTQACISSCQAIASAAEKIQSHRADIVIAGGSETFSDVPIRFSRPLRARFLQLKQAMKGGLPKVLKLFSGLSLKDLAPVAPAIQNFHTHEVMGHSSDRLAARFGVTREEMDAYALDSHAKAAKAHDEGHYDDEVMMYNGSRKENLIVRESSMEKMGKLKAAFVKPHGTHTAANSSALTDGGAATLIMSEEKALELGYVPKAVIKDWSFVAVDPFEDLLLGPTFAIHELLKANDLTLADMDYIEIHEAFAGQVLANLNALADKEFGQTVLKRSDAVGVVDRSKLNTWGGSLSLGHPFGATGARMATTGANKLHKLGGKYALLAACADSGLAHACLLEKFE